MNSQNAAKETSKKVKFNQFFPPPLSVDVPSPRGLHVVITFHGTEDHFFFLARQFVSIARRMRSRSICLTSESNSIFHFISECSNRQQPSGTTVWTGANSHQREFRDSDKIVLAVVAVASSRVDSGSDRNCHHQDADCSNLCYETSANSRNVRIEADIKCV